MMLRRRLAAIPAALALLICAAVFLLPQSEARRPAAGILSITPITEVYTYGQKVSAVAIEYAEPVNAGRLDRSTFRVRDSIYNFRFNPIEDLPKLEDRTVTDVYTNGSPTKRRDGRSVPGRYVIVELDPGDTGGWTVIVSKCPTFLCTVKVNPNLLTRVIQRKDVYASSHHGHGKGRVISARGAEDRAPGHREAGEPARRRVRVRIVPAGRHGAAVPLPATVATTTQSAAIRS